MYPHHFESKARIAALPVELFAFLDDQERLSAHMMRSSPMTAGMTMEFELDERRGRAIGSRIGLSGRILGLAVEVIEVVTEREPPRRKVWETIGEPRLLVIGPYRMGFEIVPASGASELRVFIDYDEPAGAWRFAGRFLGGIYARWCTRSMAQGAARHFTTG